MVISGRLREVFVAFVKAITTGKYVVWLNVCNSKSMMNFESFRKIDEYPDVHA